MTADGKRISTAPVWDVNQNPFEDTAKALPTTGPSFGPANAKITLILFSDFECPYCREFDRTVRENIPKKYPNDVRVIFKDFPLESIHPWAKEAAEAAHCIGNGNPEAFWAFHDWVFQHQGEISSSNVREKTLSFASAQKLEIGKVTSCLDNHSPRAELEEDLKRGKELGIQQTPTFFLDGRMVPGALPWASLNILIQMELNRPAFIPAVAVK